MATEIAGPRQPTTSAVTGAYRALQYSSLVYVVGLILHTADHVRRGTSVLTPEVTWAGLVSTAIGVVVVILIFARHRLGPVLGVAFGFAEGVGVASAHLLPHWSALSDSFITQRAPGITAVSWTVVLIEVSGALAMGVTGLMALRRSDG